MATLRRELRRVFHDPANLLTTVLAVASAAVPFVPIEMVTPRSAARQCVVTDSPNLLTTTLAASPAPFSQTDWTTQAQSVRRPAVDPPNLVVSTLAVPVGSGSMPGGRSAQRVQPDCVVNLLQSTLAAPPASPFTQTDWPTPKAKPRTLTVDSPNRLTTVAYVVPPAPFRVTDWPVLPGRVRFVPDQRANGTIGRAAAGSGFPNLIVAPSNNFVSLRPGFSVA